MCTTIIYNNLLLENRIYIAVSTLKTKHRSQLTIEKELRMSISNFKQAFKKVCSLNKPMEVTGKY